MPLAYLIVVIAYAITGMLVRSTPYPVPASVDRVAIPLHLQEGWTMFPSIPRDRLRFVAPGRLADGSEIEVLGRAPMNWSRPSDLQSVQRGFRWTLYLGNAIRRGIHEPTFQATHPALLEFLCREWNASNKREHRLEQVALEVVTETIPGSGSAGAAASGRYLLATRDCPPTF